MITSDCGWLSPDGQWYPCTPEGHQDEAKQILVSLGPLYVGEHWHRPEEALENRGWAKLTPADAPMGVSTPGFACWGQDKGPTPRQARALLEWCLGDGRGRTELPACLEPDPPDEDLP